MLHMEFDLQDTVRKHYLYVSSPSVRPTVPIGGWLNTTVGMLL